MRLDLLQTSADQQNSLQGGQTIGLHEMKLLSLPDRLLSARSLKDQLVVHLPRLDQKWVAFEYCDRSLGLLKGWELLLCQFHRVVAFVPESLPDL